MPAVPAPSSHILPPGPDWDRLLASLPPDLDADALARQLGAFARPRAVRSAADLLRLCCGYALRPPSLRLTAAEAAVAGVADLSAVALGKRLRRCRPWLGALVGGLLAEEPPAGPPGARVRLVDATGLRRPGQPGADWRLHLSWELGAARIDGLELTDARGGETLARHPARPGDILVADAGYSHRRGVARLLARPGTHLAVRWAWQTLPLQEAAGAPLAIERLAGRLAALPAGGVAEWAVRMPRPDGPPAPLRLVAGRLPPERAARKRRELARRARKKGRPLSRLALLLAGWVLVLTSLPATAWPPERVLALYRWRWQVEEAFKRLKGVWELDLLPACGDDLAQVRSLATLLVALLAGRARPAAVDAALADPQRPLSAWRWEALEREAARAAAWPAPTLTQLAAARPRLERHLRDTPRRRPSQAATATAAARLLASLARASPPHRLLHAT